MIKKTKLNYKAVDYLQILIIKYEELLQIWIRTQTQIQKQYFHIWIQEAI